MSCTLSPNCEWTLVASAVRVQYDIWLVNGSPLVKHRNPFEHQFSFAEQDTLEIYVTAVIVFTSLALLQHRAVALCDGPVPVRHRALLGW